MTLVSGQERIFLLCLCPHLVGFISSQHTLLERVLIGSDLGAGVPVSLLLSKRHFGSYHLSKVCVVCLLLGIGRVSVIIHACVLGCYGVPSVDRPACDAFMRVMRDVRWSLLKRER